MKELSPYIIHPPVSPLGEETAGVSEPVVEEEEIHLWEYWWMIRKHIWFIATFFFGVVLTTAIATFMMTPIYTAKTTLLIERKAPEVLNIQRVLSESPDLDEYDFYETQRGILKSRSLAAWVIREQGLAENRLFTGEGRKGLVAGLRARVLGWVERQKWAEESLPAGLKARVLGWAERQKWAEESLPSPSRANERDSSRIDPRLVDTYIKDMLEVELLGNTRLVKVAFSIPDPKLSARVANAHAQAYIRQGLELHTRATEAARSFLEEKLLELKERVESSEVALNRYRRDKGIISLDDRENIVIGRLADLNKYLTEAEAERIALEAQVQLIHRGNDNSLPAVINSSLVQSLKGQLAVLEGEYAQLSTQFKPSYPRVAQLKAKVEEVRRRLEQEVQKVVKGIESPYLAAKAREEMLRAKMEEQKAMALGLKDASVDYSILSREVDTNKQLYDSVLQRIKETRVSAGLRASNISVIDEAEPPPRPSKPKKGRILLLGALMGLVGGVGLVFFSEYMDDTLKTREEVERYLHLPTLGMVPDFLRLEEVKR